MLLSILIALSPSQPAPVLGPLSRPIQAWFLGQLARHQPEMAKALHDRQGPKPYTVSTLMSERGVVIPEGRWLKTGEPLWIRITSWQTELSEVILKNVLKGMPAKVELYKMPFRVDGYTLDPAQNPWAGTSSFQDLADRVGLERDSRRGRLEFASPTAFRTSGADIPLPIPEHVFRSLWLKWNAFCPEALEIDRVWPEFVKGCVMVSELTNLNTERWRFAEGTHGVAIGFTGTAAFTLLPKNQSKEFREIWDGADRVLRLLSAFAYFSGVGHHTTVGMGQTLQVE